MSLKIWLPLNGDIHNQGLIDATPTVGGTSVAVNNSGKIGKCYSFGTASGYIDIPVTDIKKISGSCTVAFWLNIRSFNTTWATVFSANRNSASFVEEMLTFQRDNNTSAYTFHISNGTSNTTNVCKTGTLSTGVWYHFVLIADVELGQMRIYQNSELITTYNTSIVPNLGSILNFRIGVSSTGYQADMLLNDFRLYDEVLPVKVIKELSKGLVLHYPLNRGGFGQDNLLLNSTIPTSGSGATGIMKYITDDGLQKVVAESSNGNWCTFGNHNTTLPLTKGDSFTFSMMIKSPDSTKKPTVYFQSGLGYYSMQGNMSNNWSIIYYTGIWNIDNLSTNIHLGFSSAPGTYYIKYFKLEKGSIITPWAPNSADSLYSAMGLNNNIEYDVSGYQNNGTVSGVLSCSSDTPRYLLSTYITNGSVGHIEGIPLPVSSQTLCMWVKCDKTRNQCIFCDKNTQFEFGFLNNAIYIRIANQSGYSTTHWNNNEWNHIAVIKENNGVWNLYINGQLETNNASSNYYVHNADNFWIGNRSHNNAYPSLNCFISDVRVYTTALSADDILALYHTPTSITNNGTLMTQGEISEV